MSLLFYGWGEPVLVWVMIGAILGTWVAGLMIERQPNHRVFWLWMGVLVNLGPLGFFKYASFLSQNLAWAVKHLGYPMEWNGLSVRLPIGISFYTFQLASYVIDVYRREVPAQKSLSRLALYLSFFPQLIAGPIVRYVDVAREINARQVSRDDFSAGVRRFIIGLAQKVLLADTLGRVADIIFQLPTSQFSAPIVLLGVICYSYQIYYDFSGYSHMAIGMGRMFGFRFLENFNFPYAATSLTDFWRRWHLSLSTWFRDYLYIPLGGNRCGAARTYANLIIVFGLCGLWHGAAWSFLAWGLFHGFFLAIERAGLKHRLLDRLPLMAQRAYTLIIVAIGWILFRSSTLNDAYVRMKTLAGFYRGWNADWWTPMQFITPELVVALLAAAFFSLPHRLWWHHGKPAPLGFQGQHRWGLDVALALTFLVSIAYLAGGTFHPFIYFRF